MRQLAARLLSAAAALGLVGCSALPWNKPKPEATEPAVALRDMYRVQIDAPDDLKRLLTTYLDLARFQRAPEADQITVAEIDRLAAAARVQARALAETEGYFNAQVEAQRLPAEADGLPIVQLSLKAGPRTTIDTVELKAEGALQQALEGQGPEADDARGAWDELRAKWLLKPGQAFRQASWSDAKSDSLTRLHAEGYPAASWRNTSARVDAPSNRASLYALLDSGPVYRMGEVSVGGLQRYQPQTVRNLVTFSAGARYSEKAMLDTQERLQRSGLFEGVVVDIDPDPATAAAAPVRIVVRELPLQQATLGLGYSDATGQRITVEHLHRRAFGRSFFGTDLMVKNKLEFGRDQQLWEGDLSTHPLQGGYRNLLSVKLLRQSSLGTAVGSLRVRAGRAIESERIERLMFAELEQASTRSSALDEFSRALSGNYHWIWRDVDSVLLPTQGLTASAEAGLGYAWSATAPNGAFSRLRGRLTAYRPLGRNWFGSARLEAGQVFSRATVAIPDTLLFRAGGDDSVRGYAYRSLGPLDAAGVVGSGRVLLTASGEVATPISARMPSVWWALFADAGNAADSWGELKPVFGYGAGIRWRSPVGPLRLDLAYADELRKTRLHLSVGIAF